MIWKKLGNNWSWADTATGMVIGAFFGMTVTMYAKGAHSMAMKFLNSWSSEIVELFLISLLLGRMVAVARWKRVTPINYNKITFPGVIAAHFLSIIMGAMLLIITLALVAPGVLELAAKHF